MSALDKQVGGNHYRQGAIQPVQYFEANDLKYLEASVIKRCTRHDKPTGKGRQDIEKAIHELELLLELRYPIAPPAQDVAPPGYTLSEEISERVDRLQPGDCFFCGPGVKHGGLPCPNNAPKSVLCAGDACITVPDYVYSQ